MAPPTSRRSSRRRFGPSRRRPSSSTRRTTSTSSTPATRRAIPLALANPRVVVSRTFSKIYGMAGLRVGFAVGQPATLDVMNRYLDAGRLSCLSARAALTALADPARVSEMRAGNHAARAMTVQAFRDAGYRVADSEANFVMVDVRRDIRVFQPRLPKPGRRHRAAVSAAAHLGAHHHRDHGRDAAGGRGVPGRARRAVPTADALPALERYVPRRDGTWAC